MTVDRTLAVKTEDGEEWIGDIESLDIELEETTYHSDDGLLRGVGVGSIEYSFEVGELFNVSGPDEEEDVNYADVCEKLLDSHANVIGEFGGSIREVYPHVKMLYEKHGPFEIDTFENCRWPIDHPPRWYDG